MINTGLSVVTRKPGVYYKLRLLRKNSTESCWTDTTTATNLMWSAWDYLWGQQSRGFITSSDHRILWSCIETFVPPNTCCVVLRNERLSGRKPPGEANQWIQGTYPPLHQGELTSGSKGRTLPSTRGSWPVDPRDVPSPPPGGLTSGSKGRTLPSTMGSWPVADAGVAGCLPQRRFSFNLRKIPMKSKTWIWFQREGGEAKSANVLSSKRCKILG